MFPFQQHNHCCHCFMMLLPQIIIDVILGLFLRVFLVDTGALGLCSDCHSDGAGAVQHGHCGDDPQTAMNAHTSF